VENHVRRLQVHIAKAIKLERHSKAKALQWILTHSYYAKLLVRKDANPYDPEFQEYFQRRQSQRNISRRSKKKA